MKVTIRAKKLETLMKGLHSCDNMKGKPGEDQRKLAYAIAKNFDRVERELDIIRSANKPDKEYDEYEEKRKELCRKHALKDEKGQPTITFDGVQHVFVMEDQEFFDSEMEVLQQEYQAVLEREEQRKSDHRKWLEEEEIQFEGHAIKEEWVPEDVTPVQMRALLPFLEPEQEKPEKKTRRLRKPRK